MSRDGWIGLTSRVSEIATRLGGQEWAGEAQDEPLRRGAGTRVVGAAQTGGHNGKGLLEHGCRWSELRRSCAVKCRSGASATVTSRNVEPRVKDSTTGPMAEKQDLAGRATRQALHLEAKRHGDAGKKE